VERDAINLSLGIISRLRNLARNRALNWHLISGETMVPPSDIGPGPGVPMRTTPDQSSTVASLKNELIAAGEGLADNADVLRSVLASCGDCIKI
jgi:hypothetical protein